MTSVNFPVRHEYIVTAQVSEANGGNNLCNNSEGSGCLVHIFMDCDLFPEEFDDGDPSDTPLCYTFGANVVTGDFGNLPPGYLTVVSGAMGKNQQHSLQPGTFLRIGAGSVVATLLSGATIQKDWIQEEVVRPSVGSLFIVFAMLPWILVALLSVFFFKEVKTAIPTSVRDLLVLGRSKTALPVKLEGWDDDFPQNLEDLVFGFVKHEERVCLGLGKNPVSFTLISTNRRSQIIVIFPPTNHVVVRFTYK